MVKNYFKIAIRQLLKNKFYSLLNILGLGIGLAACLLIFFYVKHELSYDQFHKNKDRIYRVYEIFKTGDGTMATGLTPYKMAWDLDSSFTEIEKTARVDFDLQQYVVKYGDKKFFEESISSTESDFFSVFSFSLLEGNKSTVLNEPYTVAISDEKAKKYFPGQSAMGKVLEFMDPYNYKSFQAKITGVFKAMPDNSHFHKDFFLSSATTDILIPQRIPELGWTSHFSYLLLSPKADPAKLEKAINAHIFKTYPKNVTQYWSAFRLQSLKDIHLRSHLKEEQEANGDINNVYIFSAIALFIILLAGINYMNLATSRAVTRSREVGVRKVVGASKRQLIAQFLAESIILTFISLILAGCLATLALPAFNALSGKNLHIDFLQPGLLAIVLGFALLIGLFAGSYPAFFLSAFQPVKVLKGALAKTGGHSLTLRRTLVVLQFSISIILIIGTLIIYQQWDYLQTRKLGISSEQVLIVRAQTAKLQDQYPVLKNELLRNATIEQVTGSRKNITARFSNYTDLAVQGSGEQRTAPWTFVDNNFFKAFHIPIVKGNDFPARLRKDTLTDFILNESAAQLLGLKEPVGTMINALGRKGRIIGVAKDFNFESLHTPISPVVFIPADKDFSYISIKIKSTDLRNTIGFIKKQVSNIDPEATFDYSFLDDNITSLYKSEAKFLQVFTIFSGLAILIACLGIVGLAAFTASQRTKEIGIRKVLGASVQNVSLLLTKEFIKLVLLANLIAWPVAYYCMKQWLQDFPYRIQPGVWMFVLAALIALIVAIITVSFQTIKAAVANPVKSLRTE